MFGKAPPELLAWQPGPFFEHSNYWLRQAYEGLSQQLTHERNLEYARKAANEIAVVRAEMQSRLKTSGYDREVMNELHGGSHVRHS